MEHLGKIPVGKWPRLAGFLGLLWLAVGSGAQAATTDTISWDADPSPRYSPQSASCSVSGVTLSCGYMFDYGAASGQAVASGNLSGVLFQSRSHTVYQMVCAREASAGAPHVICWNITAGADFNTLAFNSLGEKPDADGDLLIDEKDTCPAVKNSDPTDTDGDGMGDVCDGDDDNDGLNDEAEAQLGTDPLYSDTDGDRWPDGNDNCPVIYNEGPLEGAFGQLDADEDGVGDECDSCPTEGDRYGQGVNTWGCPVLPPFGIKNDLDADGDGDLVLSGVNVTAWYMENNTRHNAHYFGTNPEGGAAQVVATPDTNGDGDNDMVFQVSGGGNVYLWDIEGASKTASWLGSTASLIKAGGDVDGDGDGDLVLDDAAGSVSLWMLQGSVKLFSNYLGTWPGYRVRAVADIDDDWDKDLVLGDSDGNVIVITVQNGQKLSASWLGRWAGNVVVDAGDADGDGDEDIVMETSAGSVSLIKMQNGQKQNAVWLGQWAGHSVVAVGDIDADGDADLIQQNASNGSAQVVELQNAAKVTGRWLGAWAAYLAKGVIDANGDGDVDVVLQDGSGNVNLVELQNGAKVLARWQGVSADQVTVFK